MEINLMKVERDLPTNIRHRTIEFKISKTAMMLLALDDHALVREAYPSLEAIGVSSSKAPQLFKVYASDAWVMASDLNERSIGGEWGYGHTPYERYAARVARDVIVKALQDSL